MGYGFDWAWSGLGLVFMGLGWAGMRIIEPIPNTGAESIHIAFSWYVYKRGGLQPAGVIVCRYILLHAGLQKSYS